LDAVNTKVEWLYNVGGGKLAKVSLLPIGQRLRQLPDLGSYRRGGFASFMSTHEESEVANRTLTSLSGIPLVSQSAKIEASKNFVFFFTIKKQKNLKPSAAKQKVLI
jgi:hypothetical protein